MTKERKNKVTQMTLIDTDYDTGKEIRDNLRNLCDKREKKQGHTDDTDRHR